MAKKFPALLNAKFQGSNEIPVEIQARVLINLLPASLMRRIAAQRKVPRTGFWMTSEKGFSCCVSKGFIIT